MIERDLFTAARRITDPKVRSAFLDGACGGDAELRARLDALLCANDHHHYLLDLPVHDTAALRTLAPVDRDHEVLGLGFLAPTSRPDSLGRFGHYEVLEVLGRGGFGIVFLAFDDVLHRFVAVKVLCPQLAACSSARKRFLREARSSAKVRHDKVVQVYEVGVLPIPYLVMEYIPGETLQQRLARTGPLQILEVLRIGRQIAEALAAAHDTDLIHRDVKPANVLLESNSARVKVTDFGLARAADDASISQSGLVAGTPMYMAPEQAEGRPIDQRADLFSLGSVLYQMVTGLPPFRANGALAVLKRVVEDHPRSIREIVPETPQWLCEIISRLHAKRPDERFQTAQEVVDLLRYCESEIWRVGGGHPPGGLATLIDGSLQSPPLRQSALPSPRVRASARFGRWASSAAAVVLFSGLGYSEATGVTDVRGMVVRCFVPGGILVIEVDDPGCGVKIDGTEISITGAGVREIRLSAGRHTVEGVKNGKVTNRELISISKEGRQVVRISEETKPALTFDPDRRAAVTMLKVGGSVWIDRDDREIREVADLPRRPFRLTIVTNRDNPILTDDHLIPFEECRDLEQVYLWGSLNLSDNGLHHLRECKRITALGIGGTKFSDAGLSSFKELKTLGFLHVANSRVTAVGLANFKQCRNLRHLNLDGCYSFTDRDAAILLEWSELRELFLDGTAVTDAGVTLLEGLKNLTFLRLQRTRVTKDGIGKLAQALPGCRILWDDGEGMPSTVQ